MKKLIFIALILFTAFHFSAVFASSGSGGGGGEVIKDGHLYYTDEQGEPLDIPVCKCPDDAPVTCRCMTEE
jgi:hypothetical protein